MNLILFLLLGLTACWTGLVQSEESPEITEEELVVVTTKAEVQDKENNGDVAGSGYGMSQTTSDLGSIQNNTKEDAYLDDDDHEKVPMPMFEDDIPSVMELEMEDLENWMAKDGGKKVDTGQI
ncbi:transmembrane protein 154 isoform X2 [Danio rerio]|uniref:Transmembrane protein 154 isoform X2 n=1 Tax=Danio rerio TaxID=7955 RepID=A0AC58GJE5_DANRE